MTDYRRWYEAVTGVNPKQNRWDRGPMKTNEATKVRFRKQIEKNRLQIKNDDSYIFSVFEKRSGRLIGAVDFDIFVRSTHQFANFGYFICNTHWGHGYGQEAARAGLKIGFKQLKLNRLEAAINFDNRKSIRLAKAIGMKREGIKRRYWYEYGDWVDHLIFVANPEDVGLRATKPF